MGNHIQAVIFDIGGVLIRTVDHSGRQKWEHQLGLQTGDAETIVLNSDMGKRAQLGLITTEELWTWVAAYLGLETDMDAFRQDFWSGDIVDTDLVNLIRRLRRHYQVAALSNATDNLLTTLDQFAILNEFDLIVGSAFEGVMKPDPAIYARALERLGREPSETIFIDDALANVLAAQALGMYGIQFLAGMDLAAALRATGVRI